MGRSTRVRRLGHIVGLLGLMVSSDGCGDGANVSGGDPPGREIAGTGAVNSSDEAAQRVLNQVVGLAARRQDGPVVGTGADPTDVVYRLQDGPTPRGTTIRPFFEDAGYELNRDYFVFFIDRNILADFQHSARFVYVRPSDGALFVQDVEAFPVVNGTSRLTADADRQANLVYLHEGLEHIAFPEVADRGRQMSNAQAGGLFLGGAAEGRRQNDLDNATEYMQELTGEANPLSVLWHKHPDPIDNDDLADKLRTASAGLGEGDKFFLFISTHGAAPPDAEFAVGDETMTYEELCKLINDNVSAGHVNIFNSACFGGQMDDAFKDCDDDTAKAFHWFAATDSSHPNYSCPDGVGARLALAQLREALAAAGGDGSVTLGEVEAAMDNLDVTDDQIIEEICKCLEGTPEFEEICNNLKTDDGDDDEYPRPGKPKKGSFGQDPPPGGGGTIDDGDANKNGIPDVIEVLLEKLRKARENEDGPALGPLYHPDYLYDGRTFEQIARPLPGVDTRDLVFTPTEWIGLAPNGSLTYHATGQWHFNSGGQPGEQDFDEERVIRVKPDGQGGPRIEADFPAHWRHVVRVPAPNGLGNLLQPVLDGFRYDDHEVGGGTVDPLPGGGTFQVDSFFDIFTEISVDGGASWQAGASLAGATTTLTPQAQRGRVRQAYTGRIQAPSTPGRYRLAVYVTNTSSGQSGAFTQAVTAQSIEVVIQ